MSAYTEPSRALAAQLRAGDHALSNQQLREIYGLSRVTAKARGEVAQELRRAGLEVLSDPRSEPLFVRKLAPVRAPEAPRAPRAKRPWWRRPWAIAVGAFLGLCILVAALDPDGPTPSTEQAALGEPVVEATATPTATATPEATPAAETIADARDAVADDDYSQALAIAAVLGDDGERSVKRRIARRLAFRATKALKAGNRSSASRLLREARDYPRTAEIKRAGVALGAAQERARERAAAKRRAAEIARAERAARAQARRAARAETRRRAELAEAAESAPPATSEPEPSMSGPSTTNWCGKRDGDGDGIYCEGL